VALTPLQEAGLARIAQAALDKAASVKDDPKRFAVYRDTPYDFFADVWGVLPWDPEQPDVAGLTPDQCTLIDAIVAGETNIAIKSGHSLGKTYLLALVLLWWLYGRGGKVVTTASTWGQVERILWVEIAKQHQAARVTLPGDLMQTELRVAKGWFAVGISTDNPTAFQGFHDPNLLVLVDEAPGVEAKIHDSIGSLATGEKNVVVKVGNPTESSGPFYEHFRKGNWCRLHFSPFRHPNVLMGREVIPGAVTLKWIEDKKAEWGEGSPIYASRVLGEFPEGGVRSVVPLPWVDRAMAPAFRDKIREAVDPMERVILACDVARYGDDRTTIAVRKGGYVSRVEVLPSMDLMDLVGTLVALRAEVGAHEIVVDVVGLGSGVVDRLQELGEPVWGFHSGSRPSDKSMYQNRRAEMWFRGRRMLELEQLALPDDDDLRADLTTPTYTMHSTGKLKIESKEDMKRRGLRSTDLADAVLMTLALDLGTEDEPEMERDPDRDMLALVGAEEQASGPLSAYGDWI
jgi:phage terminase large subunit